MPTSDEELMRMQYGFQGDIESQKSQDQAKLYAPQLREQLAETQAAVIAQTNPAKALKVIIEGLKGRMIDEKGETIQIGVPLMNEKGIQKISSILLPVISDPIRFGNISGKEVRALALSINDHIAEDIGKNWRDYEIEDDPAKELVCDSLLTLTFITLTRSEEQNEKIFLSKVILESIGAAKIDKSKRGSGIWDKFKF